MVKSHKLARAKTVHQSLKIRSQQASSLIEARLAARVSPEAHHVNGYLCLSCTAITSKRRCVIVCLQNPTGIGQSVCGTAHIQHFCHEMLKNINSLS